MGSDRLWAQKGKGHVGRSHGDLVQLLPPSALTVSIDRETLITPGQTHGRGGLPRGAQRKHVTWSKVSGRTPQSREHRR